MERDFACGEFPSMDGPRSADWSATGSNHMPPHLFDMQLSAGVRTTRGGTAASLLTAQAVSAIVFDLPQSHKG
ncbi:hypothetical protein HaLaN_32146 [Haematococcus lacustris]|uniref:Uncharacterized protein n=1 Tax=Haematococcus lacustris TaxID=44745 RepID=A0A6A0AJU6_HAELA|nr:hypothetical protein HaLaN_32146 [Haematococcus lacustris]